MNADTMKIVQELRNRIATKYRLVQFSVFGSSARGDAKEGSDIDVWVCLEELNRDIEEDLFDIAYDMELENDCLIDLIAVSKRDLSGRIGKAPIQKHVLSEGISI
jgi:predicted nucleotidyltransferase